MFNHPPTLIAILASVAVAIAWLALGWWSGTPDQSTFPLLASIFWGVVIAILLATMWAVAIAETSPESQTQFLLPLLLFAAVPLDGLASLIPLPSQLVRCIVVAVGLLIFSLAFHATARVVGKRRQVASLSRGDVG